MKKTTVQPRGLPDYVVAMVRRSPPRGAPVVPNSTPVIAFGDPARATVATLGINPSVNEFLGQAELLTGTQRRLATLQSLAAQRVDRLTDAQVATVAEDCATYFQRRPYRRWFDPLDELLRSGVAASYYDGSACHLDLVQWATNPIWSGIADSGVREALLEDGVPHLRAQLRRENVRLVLMNGRQVLNQVAALGLANLNKVERLPLAGGTCSLYAGTGGGIRWVGWSANLQNSWGVSNAFKLDLGKCLAQICASPVEPPLAPAAPLTTPTLQVSGHLPCGLRVVGKTELVNVLRLWLAESQALTVGDVSNFGGRPWLLIKVNSHEIALNADTKRAAVERFVRDNRLEPDRPWHVVANRRGRFNKVLPGPSAHSVPGWYAYLTQPLKAEGLI